MVTGSAKGLGRAIALALASSGYTIVVHFRKSNNEAKKVLSQIKKKAPLSIALQADLTDESQVSQMFRQIFKQFKQVDLLVNNVGNFLYKKLSQTTSSEFRDIIESNLYSAFYCSRAVLPFMRKAQRGQIINIGVVSTGSLTITEKLALYFMAKNALYVISKAVAHEEAKYGIRINMISPVSLDTDILKSSDFPMGRSAKYEDVVKTLKFLISDDAYYINGANIEVAGAFIVGVDLR